MKQKVSMVVYRVVDGKIDFLICRRPETKIWQYPTAKCETEEDYLDCAFREIHEELGGVKIFNFTDLHQEFRFESEHGEFNEHVVAIEIDQVIALQKEEFDQYEFLALEQAKAKLEFESHRKYLEMVNKLFHEKKLNKFIILIAPTACGKSVIIKDLLSVYPDKFERVKTYMTREFKRPEDPILRVHVSKEEFEEMFDAGELIEKNFHDGNWYGSSYALVEQAYKTGKTVLAEIDINGAMNLKKLYSNVVTVFITAPLDEIEFRLRERGGHNDEEIERRLAIAQKEIARKSECDYIVENRQGKYDQTFEKIKEIIDKNIS